LFLVLCETVPSVGSLAKSFPFVVSLGFGVSDGYDFRALVLGREYKM
jgi:hypothetical protein